MGFPGHGIGNVPAGREGGVAGGAVLERLRTTAGLLLDELHGLPANEHVRERLLSIRARAVAELDASLGAVAELDASLPDHLCEELLHMAPCMPLAAAPTPADLCIAGGLLAAWLEGISQAVRLDAAVHTRPTRS